MYRMTGLGRSAGQHPRSKAPSKTFPTQNLLLFSDCTVVSFVNTHIITHNGVCYFQAIKHYDFHGNSKEFGKAA